MPPHHIKTTTHGELGARETSGIHTNSLIKMTTVELSCFNCLAPHTADHKRCAGCKFAVYCGYECQVAAWDSGHKATCASASMGVRAAGTLGRGVFALQDFDASDILLEERAFATVTVGAAHDTDWTRLGAAILDRAPELARAGFAADALRAGGAPPTDDLDHAACVAQANAFLRTVGAERTHIAFCPAASYFNGCRRSNAAWVFVVPDDGSPPRIRIAATRPIEAGEQIFLDYAPDTGCLRTECAIRGKCVTPHESATVMVLALPVLLSLVDGVDDALATGMQALASFIGLS